MKPFFERMRIGLGVLALVLVGALPARSQEANTRPPADPAATNSVIQAIRIGIGGQFKIGHWTPVWVSLSDQAAGSSGQLELTTSDSDGVPVTFRDEATIETNGAESGVWGYVKFGRPSPELTVTWRHGDAAIASRRFNAAQVARPLTSSHMWIITIGDSAGFDDSTRQLYSDPEQLATALVRDPSELPVAWFAYEGVDALVLTTSRAEVTDRLVGARQAAIDRWVRLGGRLIWTVGARGKALLSDDGPLASWLPGKFDDVGTLRRVSSLEAYAGASQRLEAGTARNASKLEITMLTGVRGRVEAPEGTQIGGEHPLIIRYPFGTGQMTMVTFDLDQPPIAKWSGRPRLVSRIFQRGQVRTDEAALADRSGQITHLGFDDLVGQLHSALEQFSTVVLVPFSYVVGLLVVYILLIGPADFFLLRKLGRPHWTWATLGVTIVGFVAMSYYLSNRWKERRLRVNQVDVVDLDVESRVARGTTWLNVYTPQSERFDLRLEPTLAKTLEAGVPEGRQDTLASWQGLPGRGLGSLGSPAASPFRQPYSVFTQADDRESTVDIGGLPIQVAATKALSARWWCETGPLPAARLRAETLDGRLEGELVNPLSIPLSDWFVVYYNWVYRGDRELGGGDRIAMTDFKATRYLDWQLTRRRVTSENKDLSQPWDRETFEIPRIVEMMMFHEAAGGSGYTRLAHRYQPYLDLTDHLRTGRAMLVGRSKQPATRVTNHGETWTDVHEQQWTVYRIILPVTVTRGGLAGTTGAN